MVDPRPVPCTSGVYKDCKIVKKVMGTSAADYEFECTTLDGKKKKVVAKGATINDNAARIMCCNGDFD
jgi:hypothetical protein